MEFERGGARTGRPADLVQANPGDLEQDATAARASARLPEGHRERGRDLWRQAFDL